MSPEEIQIIRKKLEEKRDDFVSLAKKNNNAIPEDLNIAYFQIVKAIEDFSSDQNNAIILWQKRIISAINVELYEIELKAWRDKTNSNRIEIIRNKFVLKEDLNKYNLLKKKKTNSTIIINELYEIVLKRIVDISKIIHAIETETEKIMKRSDRETSLLPTTDGHLISKEFLNYYEFIMNNKTKFESELKTGIAMSGYIPESISVLAKNFIKERDKNKKQDPAPIIQSKPEEKPTKENEKSLIIKDIRAIAQKYIEEDITDWKIADVFTTMRNELQNMDKEDLQIYKTLIEKINQYVKNKNTQEIEKEEGKSSEQPINISNLTNEIKNIYLEIRAIEDKYLANINNPEFPSEVAPNGKRICSEDLQRYNRLITKAVFFNTKLPNEALKRTG